MQLVYDINDVMGVATQLTNFLDNEIGVPVNVERITDFVHTMFLDNGFEFEDSTVEDE